MKVILIHRNGKREEKSYDDHHPPGSTIEIPGKGCCGSRRTAKTFLLDVETSLGEPEHDMWIYRERL
jgi:hypothetical protein